MTRLRVVAAVIEQAGRVLVCKRPMHKHHGGLWEFPGGKVEPGEDDLTALRRELHEELGIQVEGIADALYRRDDEGSNFTIVFIPAEISGVPTALEHDAIEWADLDKLAGLQFAPSDAAFITARYSRTSENL